MQLQNIVPSAYPPRGSSDDVVIVVRIPASEPVCQ
jgi:hypothetical protein